MYRPSLHHCFEQSKSLDEFKRRVFANHLEVRFHYQGPLTELVLELNEQDSGLLIDVAYLFVDDEFVLTYRQMKKRLIKKAEFFYGSYLSEYQECSREAA